MTRPVGERPSALEVAQKALDENAALRSVITQLVWRLEALERRAGGDGDDGHASPPLDPAIWKPIKEAAQILGFSQSGLRKHMKRWEAHAGYYWWTYRAGRLFIEVNAAPIRVVRTHT
jgi:hypothetical protein